jgi:photosystem II stability/assembly factor-like uncharacterized protein
VASCRGLVSFVVVCVLAIAAWHAPVASQSPSAFAPALFREWSWRHVGPFRGGPTLAATGVQGQSSIFYIGTAGGGAWKTSDYGATWVPMLDDHSVTTVGAMAVAPSNPNVVYAGSGGGVSQTTAMTGDGLYKSIDAGRTWQRLGLRDSRQIESIAVDPRDPTRLFVAVPGRPFGPSEERGIFRSTDGGQTFTRVLYRDADTGAVDVAVDPSNSDVVYAVLRQIRIAPWAAHFAGPGTAIYKSTDAGITWQPIVSGLPTHAADGLDRIALGIAAGAPRRLFALVAARDGSGLYRSDDAGGSWTLANAGADVADGVAVSIDPRNPDIVYVLGETVLKSTDAGRTFAAWQMENGPYRRLWFQPGTTDTMLLAGARGAAISVNGGATWSSTSAQSTAPFPSPRAADPQDGDVTYMGAVTRYDGRTGQAQNVRPPLAPGTRVSPRAPLVFSPTDPRALYFGSSVLWKTLNGGQSWVAVSPDQGRDNWEPPANLGVYRTAPGAATVKRGAIVAVRPSTLDQNTIWTGTDDGLVSLTRDAGRTWTDATPAAVAAWSSIVALETSNFDVGSAYAAVDASRIDDNRTYLYRTRNGGRSWTLITAGLPEGSSVGAIVEDRLRRGLLFAGTDRGVYVSFDDGDRWQSFRLNLPASPVRSLAIQNDDVIAGTDGRGVWVVDDITPLRQVTPDIAGAPAFLFRPSPAVRSRPDAAQPAPGERVAAAGPLGAILAYHVGASSSGTVTLEILDATSGVVFRRFSSDAADSPIPATPGLHRVVWDTRLAPPRGAPAGTPGMFIMPGTYQLRMTSQGRTYRQALVVRMDPRVRTSLADLNAQFALSRSLQDGIRDLADARRGLAERRSALTGAATRIPVILSDLERAAPPLLALFLEVQQADAKPTAAQQSAAEDALRDAESALAAFRELIDGAPGQ